ncbi:MAG TPA: pyridoxal-dependent decarboxylase [Gemmatimonadaceae bacterium]|nr:pyridoxal-dependent decarboxylase [Gemmatimonadaceae bacterium]
MPDPKKDSLSAWFLGPRAENAELLERLVTEALRDHVFWRRNYHPEDGFTIREMDKRSEGYEQTVATLTQELMGLLAELKRGVPFFSGRYKGHMAFEQTIAAQIGYFAAMLYNPNNVAVEASPVTTRLELEVAAQLARMIGYDPATSWGHIASGGTVANFEALWIARNVIYLPLAAAGAAQDLGVSLEVERLDGSRVPLESLSLWELVNVRNAAVLDLWGALWAAAPREAVRRALGAHSLATVGYQDYGRWIERRFGDPLPAGVVLVAATAHYSWEKIVRALGIGSNQLCFVPLDDHYRMDTRALWRTVQELAARRVPIMACVSVCGTTEESSIDRLDEVLAVRERAERELGVTFHVHSDACYGGYAAAVTWGSDGTRRCAAEIRATTGDDWPTDAWVRAMEALAGADSVTIDPHKLGYVPYPAGAFLLRDRRARDLVSIDPPYLLPTEGLDSAEDLFLGRFIFEGSKPGASAAAVWLSHKVLPLDARGYGYLIERTVAGARRMHAALRDADFAPFRIVLLPEPDINIVCYVMHHPALSTLEAVNAFNERVYEQLSLSRPGAAPPYIITRTRFQTPMYDGAVDPVLERVGVCDAAAWKASGAAGLVVLRSTVMDPFLVAPPPAPDHVAGLIGALRAACEHALATVVP